MLISTKSMLTKALRGRYAIGAFNVNNLEILQGVVRAAVAQRAPVIVQTSEGAIAYAGIHELVALARTVAEHARVPIALHLDHGKNLDVVHAAIHSGYTSVMYDGSKLPYAENVRNTARVVRWAHAKGIPVEAELGTIRGVEDFVSVSEREASYTIPEQALDFVERTGCDALAIAIGTAHGAVKFTGEPRLDVARLRRIHALLPKIPLVLHGASAVPRDLVHETKLHCQMLDDCQRLAGARGVPDAMVRQAIRYGIAKINTDTDLRIAFTAAVRETLITEKTVFDPRKLLDPARDAIQRVVERRISVFGSKGKS